MVGDAQTIAIKPDFYVPPRKVRQNAKVCPL
jgi:hypothetical protein